MPVGADKKQKGEKWWQDDPRDQEYIKHMEKVYNPNNKEVHARAHTHTHTHAHTHMHTHTEVSL